MSLWYKSTMNDSLAYYRCLPQVCAIARSAGAAIMAVYGRDIDVELKADQSPLTEADLRAHDVIRKGLANLAPPLPLLSEESAEADLVERRGWSRYWLVDPLDGTKEFLKRNGEFTVNIALVDSGRAVLGVVYAPALARLYYGAVGHGAWRQDADAEPVAIAVRREITAPLRVVGSRSHASPDVETYLTQRGPHELVSMGSSLKICLVAEGTADVYPRFGPTSEWDTAAAQAILESAGGRMMDRSGRPLRYNSKEDLLNPHFLAVGDANRDWLTPVRNDSWIPK
jgi:3'(2'), 5'-bisphosphate nucleotidase